MDTNNWTSVEPIVSLKNVHKSFGALEVLKGISFDVMKGEVICIIGPSGSGKSTLIRCINALNNINSGSIKVRGLEVNQQGLNKLELRKNVGMVFQQYNLFPHKTALENIMMAPMLVLKESKDEVLFKARSLIRKVRLEDKEDTYWDNCIATYTWTNGDKYIGEYKDNKKYGQGTYIFGLGEWNGDQYIGEFKNDKYHGAGIYIHSDGASYVGMYIDGLLNGLGTYTFSDGKVWQGQFKKSKFIKGKEYAAGEYNTNSQGNTNSNKNNICGRTNHTKILCIQEKVDLLLIISRDYLKV